MSDKGSSTALWRSGFLPPAKRAQSLAKRSLADLARKQRHDWWDVEALHEAVRSRGIGNVIEQLEQSNASSTVMLIAALRQEASQLEDWNAVNNPQLFLSLWRDRCFQEGWENSRRQAEGLLFDCKWASLQRLCTLEDYRRNAVDPGRPGLRLSADGRYIVDVDRELVRAWDSISGAFYSSWHAPAEITAANAVGEGKIALGLIDGRLICWDPDKDSQTLIDNMYRPIKGILHRAQRIVAWAAGDLAVWEEDGTQRFRQSAPTVDVPSLAFSKDGQRVICGDGRSLWVWSLASGKRIFSLEDIHQLSPDEEMMAGSVLDMGAQSAGLRIMDSIGLWGLSLRVQFDVLQSLAEPMAVSRDDRRMVSCEDDSLVLWEKSEDSMMDEISSVVVQDMWAVNSVVPLSPDCRYVAAVMSDGIAAWDLIGRKQANFPLPFSFATQISSIPNSRNLAVDNGQSVNVFRFVCD